LDPKVNALGRPRSHYTSKLQTHPLVREGDPQQDTRNCQTENKNLVMGSSWEPDTKTSNINKAENMGIGMQKDFFMAHSATVEVAEAVYGRMTG
jgi:hypothetical protein